MISKFKHDFASLNLNYLVPILEYISRMVDIPLDIIQSQNDFRSNLYLEHLKLAIRNNLMFPDYPNRTLIDNQIFIQASRDKRVNEGYSELVAYVAGIARIKLTHLEVDKKLREDVLPAFKKVGDINKTTLSLLNCEIIKRERGVVFLRPKIQLNHVMGRITFDKSTRLKPHHIDVSFEILHGKDFAKSTYIELGLFHYSLALLNLRSSDQSFSYEKISKLENYSFYVQIKVFNYILEWVDESFDCFQN